MSVDNTNVNINVSIFTKDDITVHMEEDIIITCKGVPILIGEWDKRGCYCVPLVEQQGQ